MVRFMKIEIGKIITGLKIPITANSTKQPKASFSRLVTYFSFSRRGQALGVEFVDSFPAMILLREFN
jgi:hypothetical protein